MKAPNGHNSAKHRWPDEEPESTGWYEDYRQLPGCHYCGNVGHLGSLCPNKCVTDRKPKIDMTRRVEA